MPQNQRENHMRKSVPTGFCSLLILLAFLSIAQAAHAGYTHYWTWHQPPHQETLKKCISEMRQVVNAGGKLLAGPDGTGSPMIQDASLVFNGVGQQAHEPFIFPGKIGFNFCKTQYKSYDKFVVACLLVAADYFPSPILEIKSDGQWSAGDWQEGASLYSTIFGRSPHNPMQHTNTDAWMATGSTLLHSILPWTIILIFLIILIVIVRLSARRQIQKTEEHMNRSRQHMENVEALLTRIAQAVEK
jgi:hypothetical protein